MCCNCKTIVDKIFHLEGCRESQSEVSEIEVENHTPSREKDPCRHCEALFDSHSSAATAEEPTKNSSDDPRHKLLLSLSCAHKTGKGNEAITASLSTLLDQDCGPETQEDEVALRLMCALLHEPPIKSHAKIWKENHFPR